MIAICTCIISFFSCLHAQNSVVWVNEKCIWWHTKEQCEFCQRGAQTAHSIWSSTKQNQKNKSKQNIRILKALFFFQLFKMKVFYIGSFKWKVVPFQFFPWATKVFFLFLLFCLLHFLCHRRMQKKNKEWKQWKKNGGKYRCLKVSSKISNFTVILNIKLENYSVWSNNVRFLFKVRLCCHWSC